MLNDLVVLYTHYLPIVFVFALGLMVGSFLNVVILRYNNRFFKKNRSVCLSCGEELGFFDLIPLFSYLFLAGKCKYCKSRISIQYPLVEFFTGITFLLIFLKIGFFNIDLLFYFAVWSLLIVVFVYDLKHKIIPQAVVYSLIALSLLKVLFFTWPILNPLNLSLIFDPLYFYGIIAGPIAFSPFAFLWLISKGSWMGFGDAKLALALGWLLGLSGVINSIVIAFWIGAIVGILLIALSKLDTLSLFKGFKNLTIKSEIPFGPFLVIGTALVFFMEVSVFDLISWF